MTTATTPKGYTYPNGDDPISNGDNVIATLAGQIDTHLGRIASGQISAPAAGPQSVAVTWPVGRFTAAPRVTITPYVTASASNPAFVGYTAVTASGATITADRAAGGAYTVVWTAVQV